MMDLNHSARLIYRGVAFFCLMIQALVLSANGAPGKKPQPAVDPAALAAANQPQLLHAGTDPTFRAPVLRASGWSTRSISFGWLEITREHVRYEVVQPKSKMNEGLDLPLSSISKTEVTGDGMYQVYVKFEGGGGDKVNSFACASPDRWRSVHDAVGVGVLLKYSEFGTRALASALINFDAALDKALAQPFRDGDHNKVQALLKDNPDLLLAKDGKGMTPLHWAAEGGHLDMVEYVLAGKLDVNIRDKNNNTPLHEAARVGHRDVAELLLGRGALVDAPNGEGAAPLIMAAQNGWAEVVDLLLAKGANVNARMNGAVTPLLAASEAGHMDVVRLLLASHADANAGGADGTTPLISAAWHGGRMITESVRVPAPRPGAPAVERDTSRWIQPDYKGIVDLLLASSADVNASTKEGQTALTSAAALGEAPIVQALLAKGANANARQTNGGTALLLAVGASTKPEYPQIVDLLLAKGAGNDSPHDPVLVPGTPELINFLETHQDMIFFTSRESPLRSLSELTSDVQFGSSGPGSAPEDSIQDMFKLKQIVTGKPGSMVLLGDGGFTKMPQLELFITFREVSGFQTIESGGGGRLVFFVNAAVPSSPK